MEFKTAEKGTDTATGLSRWVIGVDGGGSKTAALLAGVDAQGDVVILGRGRGGPSNLRLAGKEQSLESLEQAIAEAMAAAGVSGRKLDYAVLALAGSTSPDVQRDVAAWAEQYGLAEQVEIVHDVAPVLAMGAGGDKGVALIVGTGSVAVGIDAEGQYVLKGGWGHWFGDKGSGFYLGYKALAAVAEASDEIGPETVLSELVLKSLGTVDPRSILEKVLSGGDARREVAALAPVVLEAAGKNDVVALRIVSHAVSEAAKLVTAVVKSLGLEQDYPLAIAGGVICGSQYFRDELGRQLMLTHPAPSGVTLVEKPVLGCLKIAADRLMNPAPPGESGATAGE